MPLLQSVQKPVLRISDFNAVASKPLSLASPAIIPCRWCGFTGMSRATSQQTEIAPMSHCDCSHAQSPLSPPSTRDLSVPLCNSDHELQITKKCGDNRSRAAANCDSRPRFRMDPLLSAKRFSAVPVAFFFFFFFFFLNGRLTPPK